MADVPSSYLTTFFGVEQPFKQSLTTTSAVALVTAGSNGARVTLVRASEKAGGTPTLTLDILASDGVTSYSLHTKALTAGQVYRETDVRLLGGEKLRATASVSNQVDVTGLYVTPPR